ncbi:MAG: Glucosamine-1-phosphate N-acetyltransferase [Candidatus Ozemobacter sibiricus]|jgi:NDP-sugar pyrophosphorylase family protein|uniref:Glucosamine-1-phosphate N-acetyltransferase n=1 Tax=Candidatus Ozemobacter sibiricus TaxID=2268124 RepID=A0A367ZLT4_9BACT|nr:MAG: Glucosamine-1-phosphate N-acetyltransferase [Candidatus Ozemobacter sibiricus]
MFERTDFFKNLDGFPFPELFDKSLKGFDDLTFIWDVIKRIQAGFIAQRVKPQILGVVEEGAILKGEDIFIGRNSRVQAGAMIIGPTILGANVEVRHGAYIRGHVIAGDGAVIGHASEVIRSVLLPGAKAPHFNYVGDSILGARVNLGAGTKLSNLKNDGSEVKVHAAGTSYKTGLKKFGAILGDGCMLGCNTVTNPGTLMGPNCRVYPNATVTGYYVASTIVKLVQELKTARVE